MRLIPHLAICAAISMAACTPATTPVATTAVFAPAPATNANAGPGATQPDAAIAGEVFGKACLAEQPTFRNTPTALSRLNFVQNSRTGTYYSANYDMSLKLLDRDTNIECSIIFANDQDQQKLARAFGEAAAANGNGKTGDVGLRFQEINNATYINARIISPK